MNANSTNLCLIYSLDFTLIIVYYYNLNWKTNNAIIVMCQRFLFLVDGKMDRNPRAKSRAPNRPFTGWLNFEIDMVLGQFYLT